MRDYILGQFEHGELTVVVRQYGESGREHAAHSFVLVHGIGASSRYFARLANELRRHGVVYAVELPGFGTSPRPSQPLGIDEFAALLREFIEAWNIEKPVLVGHSMGAQVVTEMAIQDSYLTDCLVLIGPVIDPKAPTAVRQGIRLFRAALTESPSANWIVATDYIRCGPLWYHMVLPAMLSYRIEERLHLIKVPTLIIRGSRDPVAPAGWVRHMIDAIPRASGLEIPGASHVVHYDEAKTVAAAILAHARAAATDFGLVPEP